MWQVAAAAGRSPGAVGKGLHVSVCWVCAGLHGPSTLHMILSLNHSASVPKPVCLGPTAPLPPCQARLAGCGLLLPVALLQCPAWAPVGWAACGTACDTDLLGRADNSIRQSLLCWKHFRKLLDSGSSQMSMGSIRSYSSAKSCMLCCQDCGSGPDVVCWEQGNRRQWHTCG